MTTRARFLALSLILFIALTYLFAWSSVFSVRSIATVGLPSAVTSESMIEISNIHLGDKLSRIEPRSIERAIGELSWVKDVAVERNWLKGSVRLTVTSRTPVGMYKGKALDSEGTIFELPGKTPAGLPEVSAASPQLGLEAIDLFTHLPADLREGVISVSAANANSIASWQKWKDGKLKVMWGSASDVDLKVTVLRALLQLPENKDIKRVDLSAPHAPIVK